MNSFINLRVAIITFGALLLLSVVIGLVASSSSPSDKFLKEMVEKQVTKRLKGGTITSISIIRGAPFPCGAHASKTPYGTMLYPAVVTISYVTKPTDGSTGETNQMTRSLYLYKDSTHHWVNDDELH
jgi:hypothetical protein